MLSQVCSRLAKYRHATVGRQFVKSLSTRTEFTHLTDENVVKGNRKLEYPVEDCFTFLSKRFEQFGNNVAVVKILFLSKNICSLKLYIYFNTLMVEIFVNFRRFCEIKYPRNFSKGPIHENLYPQKRKTVNHCIEN